MILYVWFSQTIDVLLLILTTECGVLYDCYTRHLSLEEDEGKKVITISIFAILTMIIAASFIIAILLGKEVSYWYWCLLTFGGQFTIGLRDAYALYCK